MKNTEKNNYSQPTYRLDNYLIAPLHTAAPDDLVDFFCRNRAYFQPFFPLYDETFYSCEGWNQQLKQYPELAATGKSIRFVIMDHKKIIGMINFTDICRGFFDACYLGYNLDPDYQGQGIMTKTLTILINHITTQVGITRIMANYLEDNIKSAALLKKLSFIQEGFAEKYLKINGRWQGHVLTSFTSPHRCP